ncbi:MAG: reverse transcriptase N-terminal domain-containing protein [Chloroflexi bacterium]|nr:reverse transcriptase N-terminal domain-containing protein [Chloroflexota bacterium]
MVLNTTDNDKHAPAITGARCPKEDWTTIDWAKATKRVENLRQRIFRATQQQDWKKVHDLQKLLLRSYSNLVLSVRQITQVNNGRRTPGVDGMVANTAEKRWRLVQELRQTSSPRSKPTRRIYIPKANGKQRPLGIPMVRSHCTSAQWILGFWSRVRQFPVSPSIPRVGHLLVRRDQRCRTALRSSEMISGVSLTQ